jgi:hypothetical protein
MVLVLVLYVLILTSIMINTNTILVNPHPKPRMPAVLEWQDRKIELNLSTAVQQSIVCNSCGSTRERGETPPRSGQPYSPPEQGDRPRRHVLPTSSTSKPNIPKQQSTWWYHH